MARADATTATPAIPDAVSTGIAHRLAVEVARRLDRFFFQPVAPHDLAICRILFFLAVLVFHIPQNLTEWVSIPATYWRPIWLFETLRLNVIPLDWMRAVVQVWKIALVCGCIGLFSRTSALIACILGTYILGLPHNFGKVGHGDPVLIFAMLIFSLSRCGDALSVDAMIRRYRGGAMPTVSGEYKWPIRMAWVLLALVFFAAGATKLIRSGLEWITSDNLQILLLQHHYALKIPVTSLGLKLAKHPVVCRLLAGTTVALELLFPLALFSRRLRILLVPSAFLMQIGIGLTMGVYFTQFMICYLFWVPWSRVGSLFRSMTGVRAA